MVHYLDKWSEFDEFRKRRVFFVNIATQHTFEDYYCAVLNGHHKDGGQDAYIRKSLVPVWHRISHNVRYNLQPPYKLAFLISRPPQWVTQRPFNDKQEEAAYANTWISGTDERLVRVFPPRTKDGKEQQDVGLAFPMTQKTLCNYGSLLYIEAMLFNFIQTYIVNQELSIICTRDPQVAAEVSL